MPRPGRGLGWARYDQAYGGYTSVVEGFGKGREAAERALALDPNLAEAHALMGAVKRLNDWDWVGADASFRRALALQPGNAFVVQSSAGVAVTLGRFDEALALNRQAVELDPLSARAHSDLGDTAYFAGRVEEAVAAVKKVLELDQEQPGAHTRLGQFYLAQSHPQEALAEIQREKEPLWRVFGLALAYHALGRKKESDAALAELIAKYRAVAAYQIAEVYAVRGETDRAFEWLDRGYAQRDSGLAFMKSDPLLKNISHDPRYAAFLKKMHLPL